MDLIAALLRTARQQRDETAIIDGEHRLSWGEFVDRTARLAGGLRAYGLDRGGTAAMLSFSSHRVFEFFYAAPWAGGMMCPVNFRLSPSEVAEIMEDAAIEILLVDEAFADLARQLQVALPRLRHIVFAGAGATPTGFMPYEALLAGSAPLPPPDCEEDDVACLYYSGGTTGKAKGVMLTHRNVFANSMNFALATAFSDQERVLHCGPLFHVAAGSRIFNAVTFGATSVIMPRFDAVQVLEHIQRYRITMISLVPTMLNSIVNLSTFDHYDLSSLRLILYGAAPITLPLLATVIRRFKGVDLYQAYGQTETAPFATVLGPRYHRLDEAASAKLQSVGRPIGSVEVRVVDEQDGEVPIGIVGEVIVRGPNVMKGYLNRPALTAAALRNGWMHTGDLGYFDADGFLFIADRIKDMIISGGENVYSVEVENAISSHPMVAECAVFGIPDETWGEIVHATVVPRAGDALDPDAVIRHCRGLIGGFKLPRSVEIRTDPLPLSGVNKVLKTTLRAEYLARRGG